MLILHVDITLKEGRTEDFINLISSIKETVLNEKGCIRYEPYIKPDGTGVVMFEAWKSEKHLAVHSKQPHIADLFSKIADWQSKEPVMTKYEIAEA